MKDKMNEGIAFLIIDMQKGSFTKGTPRYQTNEVVGRINLIARQFRILNYPVIHIQHDGSAEKVFLPNSYEWEILDELEVNKSDIIISKTANDAFYRSELKNTLEGLAVKKLVISGCATDFCVESTIQSALAKDFDVTVVSDGHTTADRPQLDAKQVIDHYNWVWSNMIPTKAQIDAKPHQTIIESMT